MPRIEVLPEMMIVDSSLLNLNLIYFSQPLSTEVAIIGDMILFSTSQYCSFSTQFTPSPLQKPFVPRYEGTDEEVYQSL